jgi:L-asparaginase
MVLDDDGTLVRLAAAACDGLVIAAFGVGHVPMPIVDALADVAARLPVVLASRVGDGPVLAAMYRFPGSESDLLGRGLISAGTLDAYKARVLLHLLLASGADRSDVAAAFTDHAH